MRLSRSSIWILLVLWVLAMALSINALMQEPTGDSFLRGINRIMGFLSWQMAAAILSLGLWIGVRPLQKGERLRWLGRAPGWWSVAFVVLFIGIIGVSFVSARFATAPVPALQPTPDVAVPTEPVPEVSQ